MNVQPLHPDSQAAHYTERVRKLLVRRIGLCIAIFLLNLVPAYAQHMAPLAIEVTDPRPELGSTVAAEDTFSIVASAEVLNSLKHGSQFRILLPDQTTPVLWVEDSRRFINGDLVIHALGNPADRLHSLVLTLGEKSLFGRLSTSVGDFQLEAEYAQSALQGRLYRPQGLSEPAMAAENDYIIPDKSQVERDILTISRERIANSMSLTLNDESGETFQQAASLSGINESNLKISQMFSRRAVQVDQTVELTVTLENISNEWHHGLSVDVYFILEDSALEQAPANCVETLSVSLQEILRCQVGGLAPGQTTSVVFSVLATEYSVPHIFSTAFVGDLRSDSYISVVEDIRTDTDLDGISDFNEALIGSDPFDSDSVDYSTVIIDVMALYTTGAADIYIGSVETRINQLISVANQVYADSEVGIRLRPVYHGHVDYDEEDDMDLALSHIIDKTHSAFDEVNSLRESYGADLVMLFSPLEANNSKCGLATVGGMNTEGDFSAEIEKEFAYSVIGIDCPKDLVVAHEIGHNLGLTHSHLEDGVGGTFNFSTGYGVESEFVTVMAYPGAFSTQIQAPVFSNPQMECYGFACGVEADEDFGADAVQSLNLVKYQVANYFPSVVPQFPERDITALSGDATNAAISIAASADNGLSFVDTVSTGNYVDINIEVMVDTDHTGLEGYYHVLLTVDNEDFWQLQNNGSLTLWDRDTESLIPYSQKRRFRVWEQFKLINDYRFGSKFVGKKLSIYVAYQIPSLDELIYTPDPLQLEITGP